MCGVIFILNYFLDPIIAAGVDDLSNQTIDIDNIESDIMMTISKGDPKVKDIRALKYDPISQKIYFKLKFDDEYQEIPQYNRSRKIIDFNKEAPNLYQSRNVLTLSKWNDLQKLKGVLPRDVHFYDNLPNEQQLKACKTTKV